MQQRVPSPKSVQDESPLLHLNIKLADGSHFVAEAAPGFRLMELVRAYGVHIKAECGGAGVCATCHVRIPRAWQDALPPPSEDEQAKLDDIPSADDTSRLACQILMTDDLNGLELEIQPDSLVVHTSWVAG